MTETSSADSGLESRRFRRILVCQLRQIGDVLLATPALRLLREKYPEAEIDVFTEKRCAPALENNPDVNRVWALDKKVHKGLFRELPFYFSIARRRYDLLIDFQQLPRIRWVDLFTKFLVPGGVRLSFSPPWYNRWLFTHVADMQVGYAAQAKASVLAPLGIEWRGEPPRLVVSEAETRAAREWMGNHGVAGAAFVTLDPSHRRASRRWPSESYGRLVALAVQERPGLKFVILWGPGEEADARLVRAAARESGGQAAADACVVPESLITLRQMAAVQSLAALHLGNCSAPRHFAVAVGTPSLTILGSTSSAWTYPGPKHVHLRADLDCWPCNENACGRRTEGSETARCLEVQTPESVLPELLARLSASPL